MGTALSKICPWVGLALVLPSVASWFFWINAFSTGRGQAERVGIFLANFPTGTTTGELSAFTLATSIGAVVASAIGLTDSTGIVRAVNAAVFALASLLTCLNVFQLL